MDHTAKPSLDETRHCNMCDSDVPISEFGVNHYHADGRQKYCKRCLNDRVKASKERVREYRLAAEQAPLHRSRREPRMAEKIVAAISAGARTQGEIALAVALSGRPDLADRLPRLKEWLARYDLGLGLAGYEQACVDRIVTAQFADELAELILERRVMSTRKLAGSTYFRIYFLRNEQQRKPCAVAGSNSMPKRYEGSLFEATIPLAPVVRGSSLTRLAVAGSGERGGAGAVEGSGLRLRIA